MIKKLFVLSSTVMAVGMSGVFFARNQRHKVTRTPSAVSSYQKIPNQFFSQRDPAWNNQTIHGSTQLNYGTMGCGWTVIGNAAGIYGGRTMTPPQVANSFFANRNSNLGLSINEVVRGLESVGASVTGDRNGLSNYFNRIGSNGVTGYMHVNAPFGDHHTLVTGSYIDSKGNSHALLSDPYYGSMDCTGSGSEMSCTVTDCGTNCTNAPNGTKVTYAVDGKYIVKPSNLNEYMKERKNRERGDDGYYDKEDETVYYDDWRER